MDTSGGEKPVTVRKESPTTPSNKTQSSTTKPQITKSQSAKPQKSQSTKSNNTANSKNTKSSVKNNNTTPVSSSINLTNTTLSSTLNTNSNSNNTNSNQTLNSQLQNSIKTVTLQNASVLNGNNQLVMMSGNNQMILLPNQGYQNIQLLNSDNKNGQQSVYFNGQSINLSNANLQSVSSATGNGTAQKIMLQPHQSYSIVGNATPITTTQASLVQGTESKKTQGGSSVQSVQIGGSGTNFGSSLKSSGIQSGSIQGATIQGASIQSIQGTNIQDLLKQLGGNGAQTINLTSVGSQGFGNQTLNIGGNQYVLLNNIGNQNNISLNSSNVNAQQSVSSNNSSLINNNQTGNSSSSGKMNSNKKIEFEL